MHSFDKGLCKVVVLLSDNGPICPAKSVNTATIEPSLCLQANKLLRDNLRPYLNKRHLYTSAIDDCFGDIRLSHIGLMEHETKIISFRSFIRTK